ncbi:MAG: thioredoxin domain-containing protein [Candidatus Nanopelagicales bacterium]|jgi:thioredoxin 1
MAIPHTDDAQFAHDVLESDLPVLVEFTADWCPPCRMLAPVLEQIAQAEPGRLKVIAINTDANPQTMLKYRVLSLPTLALFIGGEVVSQTVGARPRAVIMNEIAPHLAAV